MSLGLLSLFSCTSSQDLPWVSTHACQWLFFLHLLFDVRHFVHDQVRFPSVCMRAKGVKVVQSPEPISRCTVPLGQLATLRHVAQHTDSQPYTACLDWNATTFEAMVRSRVTALPAALGQRAILSMFAGRSVLSIRGAVQGCRFRVATSHLESPCGHNQMFSKERVLQCSEASLLCLHCTAAPESA